MTKRKSHETSDSVSMNRRTLLSGAAVVGGVLAGMATELSSALGAATGDLRKSGGSPNLNPPIGEVSSGKLY
jgi:hypothetical protein